jgi:cytidine deaminase
LASPLIKNCILIFNFGRKKAIFKQLNLNYLNMAPNVTSLKITTEIEVYQNEKDLPKKEQALVKQAREALGRAYAPYSEFLVGAAVLLSNGEIITGNNQENAAYPSGLCAERVAIYYASSKFPGAAVKAIAIACRTEEPTAPCGSCRQAIAEYEIRDKSAIRIIMCSEKGRVFTAKSIESLLPLLFNRNSLT